MADLFYVALFMSLSFFCAGASAGQSALSSLDKSGVNAAAPVPPAKAAAPAAGKQPDLKLWNEYLDKNFGGRPARMEHAAGKAAGGETVQTVDLVPILNASFRSGLTFKSSANTIHVSGAEALNCPDGGTNCSANDKYFLVFTTEKGQMVLVRAKDVANALFMSGSKDITFPEDTEKYTVKLNVKLTSPGQSRLQIKGPGREALNITLDDLTGALARKGFGLTVGARHNLYYNTAILQDPKGNGSFSKEKVLIFSPRGSDPNQTVRASKIDASGVLLPKVEKDFGFRLIGEKLEIYKI
ncbi:MAG: hypothetical protein WCK76_02050 [Elusimicrobiota bacterium]